MVCILGICGSPRTGATEYTLRQALEAAASVEDVTTDIITLKGKKINFCIHCDKCIKENSPCCTLYDDDMAKLYEQYYQADGYIIASPVYEMGISAQLAAFMNRFRAEYTLVKDNPFYFSKRVGAAIAVGGTRNGGQECAINTILGFYHTQGITVVNGGLGCYGGAAVWSQDKMARGAEEDDIGIKNAKLIGRKVALITKILKNENFELNG